MKTNLLLLLLIWRRLFTLQHRKFKELLYRHLLWWIFLLWGRNALQPWWNKLGWDTGSCGQRCRCIPFFFGDINIYDGNICCHVCILCLVIRCGHLGNHCIIKCLDVSLIFKAWRILFVSMMWGGQCGYPVAILALAKELNFFLRLVKQR